MTDKCWKSKRFWTLCIVSTFFGVLVLHAALFPEMPLSRSLIYALASAVGVLIAYFAYMSKFTLKIEPKTLRRVITIMGGASVGFMVWGALVFMCLYLQLLDHPVVGALLGVALTALMLIFALVFDKLGKCRDYEPFIIRGGNI